MKTRAKFYLIRQLPDGKVDLHRSEVGFDLKTIPPVIDAGLFSTLRGMTVIAEFMLCDFFGEESDGDRKAKTLAPLVGSRRQKLGGQRADLKTNGNRSWTVSQDEVTDMVADALCTVASAAHGTSDCILEVQGQRRDLLREAARTEHIRLLN